eukprot:2284561-Alexandrium_andersonii.AAC.1
MVSDTIEQVAQTSSLVSCCGSCTFQEACSCCMMWIPRWHACFTDTRAEPTSCASQLTASKLLPMPLNGQAGNTLQLDGLPEFGCARVSSGPQPIQ